MCSLLTSMQLVHSRTKMQSLIGCNRVKCFPSPLAFGLIAPAMYKIINQKNSAGDLEFLQEQSLASAHFSPKDEKYEQNNGYSSKIYKSFQDQTQISGANGQRTKRFRKFALFLGSLLSYQLSMVSSTPCLTNPSFLLYIRCLNFELYEDRFENQFSHMLEKGLFDQ